MCVCVCSTRRTFFGSTFAMSSAWNAESPYDVSFINTGDCIVNKANNFVPKHKAIVLYSNSDSVDE